MHRNTQAVGLSFIACTLALGACSEGKHGERRTPTNNVVELPDGVTCTPGQVVACVDGDRSVARFCEASGKATLVAPCPGALGTCRLDRCVDLPEDAVCLPGDVERCDPEGSPNALICNQSATAYVPQPCVGEDGGEAMCRDAACTVCFPGARKCRDDATVIQCSADGRGWDVYQTCHTQSQVCTGNFCEELCERNVKFNSYIGCDYFAVDLDNAFVPGENGGLLDAMGAQYAVVVANPPNSPRDAEVTIHQMEAGAIEEVTRDSDGQPFPTGALRPGDLRVYRLPARNVNGTSLAPQAYRVTSTVPIIAYQFNPLDNEQVFSNDASLLLPAQLLGSEYLVMTKEQMHTIARGYFTVVAVMEGDTHVTVTMSAGTQPGFEREGSPEEKPIPHLERGQSRSFTLRQFDVLNIETGGLDDDLTGTRIVADKGVAVFGGSEGANSPNTARCVDIDPVTNKGVCEWDHATKCSDPRDCRSFITCCADHIEDQLFPLKVWGSHYVASKVWDRGLAKDEWRIMAGADNTLVTLVPPQLGIAVPTLNKGEFFEFESAGDFEVIAAHDKPILLGQFMASEQAPGPDVGTAGDAGIGDPAFILPVPIEQFRPDYVILVPREYAENFVNVVLPTGASLEVDGIPVDQGDIEPVGSLAFSVYRQKLEVPGAHTIVCSEPAGIIVYGWDQYVSYGYTGGMDLLEIRKESQ